MKTTIWIFILCSVGCFATLGSSKVCFQPKTYKNNFFLGANQTKDEFECFDGCLKNEGNLNVDKVIDFANDCKWFHYSITDKGCRQYYNYSAESIIDCKDCVSGERTCSEPNCNEPQQCTGKLLASERLANFDVCLIKSKATTNCTWVTYKHESSECLFFETCKLVDCENCNSSEVTCSHKKAILIGGENDKEGNIYAVNSNTGTFGPVCDLDFGKNEANVACRELGFGPPLQNYSGDFFGQSYPPFSYCKLRCFGFEASLDDCHYYGSPDNMATTPNRCKSAGVRCSDESLNPEVFLVGGDDNTQGNLHAFNPKTGVKGPVCGINFQQKIADIACNELGFQGAVKFYTNSTFGFVQSEFSYRNLTCLGNEKSIHDCISSDLNGNLCNGFTIAGVKCSAPWGTMPAPILIIVVAVFVSIIFDLAFKHM